MGGCGRGEDAEEMISKREGLKTRLSSFEKSFQVGQRGKNSESFVVKASSMKRKRNAGFLGTGSCAVRRRVG